VYAVAVAGVRCALPGWCGAILSHLCVVCGHRWWMVGLLLLCGWRQVHT
jgi:hypothetical protein